MTNKEWHGGYQVYIHLSDEEFRLTGNTGHQFEGPQYAHSPEGPQVEIWTHSGQDPKEKETNAQTCAQAINT